MICPVIETNPVAYIAYSDLPKRILPYLRLAATNFRSLFVPRAGTDVQTTDALFRPYVSYKRLLHAMWACPENKLGRSLRGWIWKAAILRSSSIENCNLTGRRFPDFEALRKTVASDEEYISKANVDIYRSIFRLMELKSILMWLSATCSSETATERAEERIPPAGLRPLADCLVVVAHLLPGVILVCGRHILVVPTSTDVLRLGSLGFFGWFTADAHVVGRCSTLPL